MNRRRFLSKFDILKPATTWYHGTFDIPRAHARQHFLVGIHVPPLPPLEGRYFSAACAFRCFACSHFQSAYSFIILHRPDSVFRSARTGKNLILYAGLGSSAQAPRTQLCDFFSPIRRRTSFLALNRSIYWAQCSFHCINRSHLEGDWYIVL